MKAFSVRAESHPGIAHKTAPHGGLVLAVKDQLLVTSGAIAQAVRNELHAQGFTVTVLTSLRAGLPPGGVGDVDIIQLQRRVPWDIFQLVQTLRATVQVHSHSIDPRDVSANHVLIPAPTDSHSCPWGSPSPVRQPGMLPGPTNRQPRGVGAPVVAVIDSGYQWDSSWPRPNPLDVRGDVIWSQAEWPIGDGRWAPELPDVPSVENNGVLDALAGHANFVAGVIARLSPDVRILIRNHNGGFDPQLDNFPTEASVARSLIRMAGSSVINVGFAFETIDDKISRAWDVAFDAVGQTTPVVAPAGNRDVSRPHYPAALNATYQGLYPNMIGVASVNRPRSGISKRSHFSNYGAWVLAAAIGSNVHSTFLHVNMRVEDDPSPKPRQRDFTLNDWAKWNGTSFAAPKIAALIANEVGVRQFAGINVAGAWAAVQAAQGVPSGRMQVGRIFNV